MTRRFLAAALLTLVAVGCGDDGADGPSGEGTIALGSEPSGVAVTGDAVWVSDASDATLTRVDPATVEVVATIDTVTAIDPDETFDTVLPGPGTPDDVAATDGAVWVTDQIGGQVTITRVDPATNEVAGTVDGGDGSSVGSIAATEDVLWSFNGSEADGFHVTRVDPERGPTLVSDAGGESTTGVAATDEAVWVLDVDGTLTRVDPESGDEVDTFTVDVGAAVAVAVADTALWVVDRDRGTVLRVDPGSGRVVDTIDVGGQPAGVAAGDTALWVTDAEAGTLTRVELASS